MRRDALPFSVAWVALGVLAFAHGFGLRSDAYEHFATSARIVAACDWRSLLLNLWNKPLPAMLYGVAGQAGLFAARFVSVSLTIGSAVCVWDIARHLWPAGARIRPAWVIVALVFQTAVLPEAFVTMTELPAAFALSLGLCLCVRRRWHAAFLVWGLLPLLRVEASLLVATLFLCVALATLARGRWSADALRRVAPWALLAATPMLCWWIAGVLASGDVHWFGEGSYAHVRPWSARAIVTTNAWSGLAGALSIPMLFVASVGAIRWRHIVTPNHRDVAIVLIPCVAVQLLFMSVAVVYPAATMGGQGVAAINARNFNVIAPLLALLVLAGVDEWSRWIQRSTAGPGHSPAYLVAAAVAVTAAAGFWFMQRAIGGSGFGNLYRLRAGLILLGVFWLGSAALRRVRTPRWIRTQSIAYGFLAVSTLMTLPAFWYPLRWQDTRAVSGRAFCDWYGTVADPPSRIIQDFIGSLDRFCGFSNTNADWTWPTDFLQALAETPNAWVVVTVNASGEPPAAIYPRAFLDILPTLKLLASQPALAVSPWQRFLNEFGWQNHPVGWRVYARK